MALFSCKKVFSNIQKLSFRTEKLNSLKKVNKYHEYCEVIVSNEENNVFKHFRGQKSIKAPFAIYADCERIFEKLILAIIIQKHHTQQKGINMQFVVSVFL